MSVMRRSFVQAMKTKRNLDDFILKLQGDFSDRSAKDVREAFAFDYRNKHQIQSFSISSADSHRFTLQERDFLMSAISSYNRTFPEAGRLGKEVDSFKGTQKQRRFWIEFLLRTIVLGRHQGKVEMSSDAILRYMNGKKLGTSDFVLHRTLNSTEDTQVINFPLVIVTQAKDTVTRGTPLEQAACANLFELYAYYWETAKLRENRPLYGLLTDLNSWVFQKYDGYTFYMCDESFKACAHVPALEDLSRVLHSVIEESTRPAIR